MKINKLYKWNKDLKSQDQEAPDYKGLPVYLVSEVTSGLIYNRCLRTKRGLKEAKVGTYKNKLDGRKCALVRKLRPLRTNILERGNWRFDGEPDWR